MSKNEYGKQYVAECIESLLTGCKFYKHVKSKVLRDTEEFCKVIDTTKQLCTELQDAQKFFCKDARLLNGDPDAKVLTGIKFPFESQVLEIDMCRDTGEDMPVLIYISTNFNNLVKMPKHVKESAKPAFWFMPLHRQSSNDVWLNYGHAMVCVVNQESEFGIEGVMTQMPCFEDIDDHYRQYDALVEFMEICLRAVLNFGALSMCTNVEKELIINPDYTKLSVRLRKDRGRPPYNAYWSMLVKYDEKAVKKHEESGDLEMSTPEHSNDPANPLRSRKGHVRRLKKGNNIWVRSSLIGVGSQAPASSKIYVI